jgi:hypothetical protein
MTENTGHEAPFPTPLYVLLVMAIGFCIFFFWVGAVCVRLWFYQGALGPLPEKFIIIPHHRKKKEHEQPPRDLAADKKKNRQTAWPEPAQLADACTNPFSDENALPESSPEWTTIPKVNIEDTDDGYHDAFTEEYDDPALVRRYLAEQRRISRLPAFEQDDCGDGSEFANIPYATKPVEKLSPHSRGVSKTYQDLKLQKLSSTSSWLTVDNSYIEHHEARISLIERRQAECVQVRRDGETACEELMDTVVQHLCKMRSDHFSIKNKHRRKHVRNELASKDYALVRPFDCHPLGLCARLAVEDFNIFVKDDFTLQWYL